MKKNELITDHLSPCVRIFIESILNGERTTSAARDADGTEQFIEIKKCIQTGQAAWSEKPEVENMANTISLVLHRFKDVRTTILTLIFQDSPTFKNNGAQMYLGSHELSELLQKLGKTQEEAEEILEKVMPTPSHYRLQLSLNDEQEKHARGTFTEPW